MVMTFYFAHFDSLLSKPPPFPVFSGYGHGCRSIAEHRQIDITELGYADLSMAGAYTGVLQSPARQLVERIKSVMQIHERSGGKSPYSWSGACAYHLVKTEGVRVGLFQGFSSVLLREIPQFSVYYPCYEFAKSIYTEKIPDNPKTVNFLAGGTAGVVQWLPPIYCFDVIKSRMQTAPKGAYSGLMDCARQLYQAHGSSVFFRYVRCAR
ncbi:MC/SLC25 family protein [archaeon]|nr:MAG: MC/SLC25 family protein [archaeon]